MVLAVVGAAAALAACGRGDFLLTFFDRRYAVSLQYPAGWTTEALDQPDNPSYRYFTAPKAAAAGKPLSASLLAASTSMDEYATSLTQGAKVTSTKDVERQGIKGKAYEYEKGADRYGLVLLPAEGRVHGLFLQGDAQGFDAHRRTIAAMMDSFAVERTAAWPQRKNDAFGYSLRLPPSWDERRRLSSGTMSMVQFLSPPMGVDRDRTTIHTSLTVTAEPFTGGLDRFYDMTRNKLGEAYKVSRHGEFRGGYVDAETIETPVAMSRARRFYWASKDRGYTLVFEGRDDVFHRASAWCDLIASTFDVTPGGS